MQFAPCDFSPTGHVSDSGKRMCRLNNRRAWKTMDECAACQFRQGGIGGELVPICKPPEALPCIYRGVQTSSVGCGPCGGAVIPIYECAKHGECTLSKRADAQTAVCNQCRGRKQIALPELTGPAHLALFLWPRSETAEVWREQLAMVQAAIPQFDGLRLAYVATSESTLESEIDFAGFHHVEYRENDPEQREAGGFRWMLDQLAGRPGYTVWLHGKGAARGVAVEHLRRWWMLGFATMLDLPKVREALQSAKVAGVFRRNVYAGNLAVPWHFSGSFFAVRNDAISFPESPAGGWYAEAWPALIASHDEAACLRFDGVGDLYHAPSWKAG